MNKNKLIIGTLSLTVLVLLTFIAVDYFKLTPANGGTAPPKTETKEEPPNVTKEDLQRVENLTDEFLSNFKTGQQTSPEELTAMTEQYMNKDFNQNIYPDAQQQSRWLGVFGLGVFYNKVLKDDTLSPEIQHVEGTIKTYEISSSQIDQTNNTVTTYIRFDGLNQNTKHWIEWRDIPSEGWRMNAVSFSANIDQLEQPISPKKEWQ